MKFDLRNFSLKILVATTCALLILISIFHYFTLRSINSDIEKAISTIALSRQLGNNTYEILSLTTRINSGETEQRIRLKSVIKGHETQLALFEFSSSRRSISLPEAAQKALNLSNTKWLPVKLNIGVFLDGKIELDSVSLLQNAGMIGATPESAFKILNMNGDIYLESLNELTSSLEQELKSRQESSNNMLLFFFLVEFLMVTGLAYAIFRFVIAPIKKLAINTERLSSGEHLEIRSKHFNNELGLIQQGLNRLSKNIGDVTDFVKEIGNGNLEATLSKSDDEELSKDGLESSVISMRDQMKQVQLEESIRKWSTEGLAQFVEILRASDTDVRKLGDKIISKLVEYTNSNQGGLYLINDNEENPVLELISLYAFSNKKFEEKSIRLGEGLVGQTYLEKKTTYLLEVPDDYVQIVSGLGGSNPKAILIVPLMVNHEIYGILEIASFNEYGDHEIEFIEKLGESIASTISGVKTNQRTKILLEESQQLTEQMQAQEEEMRQNMEELNATQEEMNRKTLETEGLLQDSQQRTKYIEVLVEIAKYNTHEVESLLKHSISLIGEFLEWPVAHVYFTKHENGETSLIPSSIWKEDNSAEFGVFKKATEESVFKQGIGLPGRVFEKKTSYWINDIVADPNFPRASQASLLGLHSAFGFPILFAGEVTGVVEFFTKNEVKSDDNLLDFMNQVGQLIGSLLNKLEYNSGKNEDRELFKLEDELDHHLKALDITQSQLDDNLEDYKNRINLLTASTSVIALDSDLQIASLNSEAASTFAKSDKELIGMSMNKLCKEFKPVSGDQNIETIDGKHINVKVFVGSSDPVNEYFVHWN